MPKVTFITASYNYAQYIAQTIESIINQTISDWELLVIDDGSTDNSVEIIKSYCFKDDRIKLLTHENNENKGLIKTLQLGIANAKGEYIAFVESDDYIREDYLEKKLNEFEKYPEMYFIYNDIECFGAEAPQKLGEELKTVDKYWKNKNYPQDMSNYLALQNYIPTFSCVMLKKELFEGVNWDSPQPAWTDWWLWIQISQKTMFYRMNEKLTFWHLHKDSYINKMSTELQKNYEFFESIGFILPQIKNKKILIVFFIRKIVREFKHFLKMQIIKLRGDNSVRG